MPYTKQHKQKSKQRILQSAFHLFSARGFDGVTINEIMENCTLTRGAFYAHFDSKSSLYQQAIKYAVTSSKLAEQKSAEMNNKEWLILLLDVYLSIEHVRGERACPLAFLATDIVTQDEKAKIAYSNAYIGMNDIIYNYAESFSKCKKEQVYALTSMIIGAVAVARTLEDEQLIFTLLASCKSEARKVLGLY